MNVTFLGQVYFLGTESEVVAFCAYVERVQDVMMEWWVVAGC